VEKDFGKGGRAGTLGTGEVKSARLEPFSKALRGLLGFLVKTVPFLERGEPLRSSLDPIFSELLDNVIIDFRRPASEFLVLFVGPSAPANLLPSSLGEDDRDCEEIHDFRFSFEKDLEGDLDFAGSVLLRLSR
jgi:hypothetical protein